MPATTSRHAESRPASRAHNVQCSAPSRSVVTAGPGELACFQTALGNQGIQKRLQRGVLQTKLMVNTRRVISTNKRPPASRTQSWECPFRATPVLSPNVTSLNWVADNAGDTSGNSFADLGRKVLDKTKPRAETH